MSFLGQRSIHWCALKTLYEIDHSVIVVHSKSTTTTERCR
jgi:hypothetical protein